jgi:hypothetical protein
MVIYRVPRRIPRISAWRRRETCFSDWLRLARTVPTSQLIADFLVQGQVLKIEKKPYYTRENATLLPTSHKVVFTLKSGPNSL